MRRNAEKSYFISEKGLDLSKTFEVNNTIIATVKKIVDDKVIPINSDNLILSKINCLIIPLNNISLNPEIY